MTPFEMYLGLLGLLKKYFAGCSVYPVYFTNDYMATKSKYAEIVVLPDGHRYTLIIADDDDGNPVFLLGQGGSGTVYTSLDDLENYLSGITVSNSGEWSPLLVLSAEFLEIVDKYIHVEEFDLDNFVARKLHRYFDSSSTQSYKSITSGGHIVQVFVFKGTVDSFKGPEPVVVYMGHATDGFGMGQLPYRCVFGFANESGSGRRIGIESLTPSTRVAWITQNFVEELNKLYQIA